MTAPSEGIGPVEPLGPGLRRRLRAAAMGLGTVLGIARRGYFIPHRYAADVPLDAEDVGYPEIEPLFDAERSAFRTFLEEIGSYADPLRAIGDEAPPAPRWNQGWFPRLDAAAAYAMVRSRRPRRIVEVGSGHSTRFLIRAARDAALDVDITCIDPAPRAALSGAGARYIRATLQKIGTDPFLSLRAGDMLFVDSSHILMPATDTDFLINRVWPLLPPGVIVHVHDVFLPDSYPRAWRWRGYNEQLGIAPLLTARAAAILFASRYVATRMSAELAGTVVADLPLIRGAMETSLWLEKREIG